MDVLATLAGLVDCVPADLDETAVSGRLTDVARLRGWLDGLEARLAGRLTQLRALPRPDSTNWSTATTDDQIAVAQRATSRHASRVRRRGRTLDELPALADLLDHGTTTGEHLDAIGGALAGLPTDLRHQLTTTHHTHITDLARQLDPDQLAREVRHLGDRIAADAGTSRRTRQRRATRLSTWIDRDAQMFRVDGHFHPAIGTRIQQRLDHTTDALFHHTTPDDCPDDPTRRQDFLRAHAFIHLLFGTDPDTTDHDAEHDAGPAGGPGGSAGGGSVGGGRGGE